MIHTATKTVQAQKLHKGQQIISHEGQEPLRIVAVSVCADGSIRLLTNRDEQRMSAACPVRVVH